MKQTDEFSTQEDAPKKETKMEELFRLDDQRFSKELDELIQSAEHTRLMRMKQHRTYGFIAMNLSIACLTVGVGFFGWFLLMEADLVPALTSLLASMILPIFAHFWAGSPLKAYERDHKTKFMPKLAKALNGLSFHAERGVSAKILEKLAVIPQYDEYKAEDCFMGMYKGVKVILSEARLHSKKAKDGMAFDGIFVLLESPSEVLEGHTIITADKRMAKSYETTRWKTLKPVHVAPENPDWDIFQVYSTKPEEAELFVGDRLLKELAEASIIFDNSPLTAVLFGKKYIFMMIPYAKDMFEASNMYVPVATKQHAMQCKKEIEQLFEIIDVFDLYKPLKS